MERKSIIRTVILQFNNNTIVISTFAIGYLIIRHVIKVSVFSGVSFNVNLSLQIVYCQGLDCGNIPISFEFLNYYRVCNTTK